MTISDKEFDELVDLISLAGFQEIMPHFRKLNSDDVEEKEHANDLVTIADVAAEKFITKELQARYPQAVIIGEEAVSENGDLLTRHKWDGLSFVIDPIDGTFNFAAGAPLFGTMLAIVKNREVIGAIINDPVMNDCIIARRGEGGFHKSSDGHHSKLKVAEPVPYEQMIGSVSWAGMETELRQKLLKNQARNLGFFGYRCAAHDYRVLATGKVQYVLYNKIMPWDHLAGTLIQREAGGYSARFDGSEYRPKHIDGGLLHAPSKDVWDEIKRELWK